MVGKKTVSNSVVPAVCIICVYFGPFPACFKKWEESCGWNSDIDFLIVTDQSYSSSFKNIKVLNKSLNELKKSIENIVAYQVALNRPYKLCDFKPIYGSLFREYLEGYDYWGHCDMDMVFGDLRSFFREKELSKYQRFLDLGHLSLYKNDEYMNCAYQLPVENCLSAKDAFTSEESCAFDEVGMRNVCLQNGISLFDERIFADISALYRRFRLALNDKNYKLQAFYVEDGKVFRAYWCDGTVCLNEYIYIHFKERNFTHSQLLIDSGSPFYITSSGFIEKKAGLPTSEELSKINPYPGILCEAIEKLGHSSIRRINNLACRAGIANKR